MKHSRQELEEILTLTFGLTQSEMGVPASWDWLILQLDSLIDTEKFWLSNTYWTMCQLWDLVKTHQVTYEQWDQQKALWNEFRELIESFTHDSDCQGKTLTKCTCYVKFYHDRLIN